MKVNYYHSHHTISDLRINPLTGTTTCITIGASTVSLTSTSITSKLRNESKLLSFSSYY